MTPSAESRSVSGARSVWQPLGNRVFRETFAVESWTEHLRQHERQTEADAEAHRAIWACHTGPEPPAVTHWRTTKPEFPTKGEQ